MGRIVSPLQLSFLNFFYLTTCTYKCSSDPFLYQPSLIPYSQQSLKLLKSRLVEHTLNLFSLHKNYLLYFNNY